MTTEQKEHKLLDPDTNQFHISNSKGTNSAIFTTKIFLQKYEKVELHALGDATKLVAIAAEELRRKGYVDIISIKTSTYESDKDQQHRTQKKVKFIVEIQRKPDAKDRITNELLEREQKRQQQYSS